MPLDQNVFRQCFDRFQELITLNSKGRPFTGFDEGLSATWEDYKPPLRERALEILGVQDWTGAMIGQGQVLERAIATVEIDGKGGKLDNNLVFWRNRFGHASRDHRAFIDGQSDPVLGRSLEQALYDWFRGDGDEGAAFESLADLSHRKYPLMAYLCFLKDLDRFMPIQPTAFDEAFAALGIDLVTKRHCSWENYRRYNDALRDVQRALVEVAGIPEARLIDAHSFCWMLVRLPDEDDEATGDISGQGYQFNAREKSVWEMRNNTEKTARSANGQHATNVVKAKELKLTSRALEKEITQLLETQEDRCALTGIPLQFHGKQRDDNLLPSLDRIDSNGHYEKGNLQVVCRFINFWKGNTDNEEFIGLLDLVRGKEGSLSEQSG